MAKQESRLMSSLEPLDLPFGCLVHPAGTTIGES
jgi:hypothetical protein